MKNKKTHIPIKTSFYIFGLFMVAVAFLLTTPQVVHLADTKISSFNQMPEKPVLLTDQIMEKVPTIKVVQKAVPPPYFTSGAVYAQDVDLGVSLYEKNIHKRLSPASTTKIMTALVAMEYFQPADILKVPSEAQVGGSTMGLKAGESLTFRSLLYGMMLNSGNDAAYTIALNYPGGMNTFLAKMNQKASDLGLKDTHFSNPAGFDAADHYSSAYDLAVIASEAMKNYQFARIVSTKETSVVSYDKSQAHILKNLNQLLSEPGVMGVKTGFTELAGENLVGLVDREGHKVLTVVLSSQDRFGETKSLIDWTYKAHEWKVAN